MAALTMHVWGLMTGMLGSDRVIWTRQRIRDCLVSAVSALYQTMIEEVGCRIVIPCRNHGKRLGLVVNQDACLKKEETLMYEQSARMSVA
jgi:hypothetical protein